MISGASLAHFPHSLRHPFCSRNQLEVSTGPKCHNVARRHHHHFTRQRIDALAEVSSGESSERVVEVPRVKLTQLFAHLKISKIVFVDDKAEPQIDAGTITKVLAANEAAKEPLADFFPGVTLTLANDALQEQVAARLSELDAEGVTAIRRVLAAQSDAAAEREALWRLAAVSDPGLSLPSRSWQKRDAELRQHFTKISKQIEAAREAHKNAVADLLATAIIPRGAPNRAFAKNGVYENGGFSYPIRRCGRIRDPLAASLLMAYSRFLARDAYEHDFSRAE